jgi:hypothetical protein
MRVLTVNLSIWNESGIRSYLAERELVISSESNLKTIQGSIHWHIRKKGERQGTLEFTLTNERAWFSVHANRNADWIDSFLRDANFQ